jgi:hypothetical protein
MKLDTAQVAAALAHYGIRMPADVTHANTRAGEMITITGRTDATGLKAIAVENTFHGTERLVPLGEGCAEILAISFRGRDHRGASEQKRRMLEHLLLRLSDFFDTSAVDGFQLSVCLHEADYAITAAQMNARSRTTSRPKVIGPIR